MALVHPYQWYDMPLGNIAYSDAKFFIESFVEIIDKDRHRVPFVLNPIQQIYNRNRTLRDIILKPRQLGFCCDKNTMILTSCLTWVKLGDIKIGQEIVAVDERGIGHFERSDGIVSTYPRKLRTAVVQAKRTVVSEAVRLTMDDGRVLICTPEHRWLVMHDQTADWRETKSIKVGNFVRWVCKPWKEGDFEDGWFGGIFDGEGSFRKNPKHSMSIGVCQTFDSAVFRKMESYVKRHGYHYEMGLDKPRTKSGKKHGFGNKPLGVINVNRLDELFQLVGQCQPERLKDIHWWEGRDLPGKRSGIGWAKVNSIEKLPVQEMVDLQTSEGTYIAEGFVSHNSTLIVALFLYDTMFTPNTDSVIVAHTIEASMALLAKAKLMFDSLPEEIIPHVAFRNRKELFFDKINSSFYVGSAEQGDFGRGRTISNLHLSEVSSPAFKKDFLDGLLESVPDTGRVIMESTARGEGGLYYDYYFDAKPDVMGHRRNEYKAHYYRWFDHKDYWEPLPEDFTRKQYVASLDYDERALLQKNNLSLEQIQWRRTKKARLRMKFIQEYPELDDVDAFLKSGTNVFDTLFLTERDKELPVQQPQQMWLGGNLYIYKIMEEGAKYVIGMDCSEGDINSDFTAAMVLKSWPLPVEQVALLHGRWTPDIASEKVWRLGKAYNQALICVERNNHGHAVLLNLSNGIVRKGVVKYPTYPNTFVGPDKKLGFLTTPASKPQIIDELDRVIRSNEMIVNSKQFIFEARRFVTIKQGMTNKYGYGVPEAVGNDDIVMATAIALVGVSMGKFSFSFD